MDAIKQKKMQKLYQDYYYYYNKVVRPYEEKKETPVVQGTVSWQESVLELVKK